MPSATMNRLAKIEARYRAQVAPDAQQYVVHGGPHGTGPLRCTDGKATWHVRPGEGLLTFRERMAREHPTSSWLVFLGLPAPTPPSA